MVKLIFSLVKISNTTLYTRFLGTLFQLWSLAQGPGGGRLVRAAGHQAALLGVPPADINHNHIIRLIEMKILT